MFARKIQFLSYAVTFSYLTHNIISFYLVRSKRNYIESLFTDSFSLCLYAFIIFLDCKNLLIFNIKKYDKEHIFQPNKGRKCCDRYISICSMFRRKKVLRHNR